MAKKIREFMTHREPAEHIWMERDENAVIGTARMGQNGAEDPLQTRRRSQRSQIERL